MDKDYKEYNNNNNNNSNNDNNCNNGNGNKENMGKDFSTIDVENAERLMEEFEKMELYREQAEKSADVSHIISPLVNKINRLNSEIYNLKTSLNNAITNHNEEIKILKNSINNQKEEIEQLKNIIKNNK